MSAPNTAIELVELAYDIHRDRGEWIAELGETMRGLVSGVVSCFAFELSRPEGSWTLGECWAEDPRVTAQVRATVTTGDASFIEVFAGTPLMAGTAAELLGRAGIALESTPLPELYATMGIAEQFAVSALGPSGTGVVLGMCLDNSSGSGPSEGERVMLSQIGAHVAAGARLHQRLEGAPPAEHGEAILRPDGKLEHATPPGQGAAGLLAEAVKRIELARRRGRCPREALELWQGLVAGRWSMVDHFDSDGRRYYVAARNSPQAARGRALTPREAEIVAYIASGTTTKSTAYALGIDARTVGAHVRSAMAKLGLRSRPELIALRTMLLDGDDTSDRPHSASVA